MRLEKSGILVIDKPPGMSSAQAVAEIKKVSGARKVGHAGTLDPLATGVLVCCLNSATRLSRFLLSGRKTYAATLFLGIATDTQDRTGAVIARADAGAVTREAIRAVCDRFTGRLAQQPPVYSALKHEGTPLYRLARSGQPVQKPPRPVTIFSIALTGIDGPRVRFEVECSAGTYIRTLCADMGAALGCGGHLADLRRLRSSGFTIDEALSLTAFRALTAAGAAAGRIIPMAPALRGMPEHTVSTAQVGKIRCGHPLGAGELPPELASTDGHLKLLTPAGCLLAVVRWREPSRNWAYLCVMPAEACAAGVC
ncbi:MAG: tRNA pseudouridine(55) synthase TruB [Desulfobacteraceae bacterium]|jgi:tRNA pseudouridine55 synthase